MSCPLAAPTELLHPCDSLEGARISVGARLPDATLELSADPRFVSEGEACTRLAALAPQDDSRNTYIALDLSIPPTDFSSVSRALVFDAWTDEPETSRALYVRGYDAAGTCVLSWASWSGALAEQKTTFELHPTLSERHLRWEDHEIKGDDASAVTTLRFYVGIARGNSGRPFSLYLDNIRSAIRDVRSFADVTEARPLQPDTPLVRGGQAQAVIITSEQDGWRALAEELATTVHEATGVTLPVMAPAQMDQEQLEQINSIIIGNIVNNVSLLYLYSHSMTFADGFYPGPGGYELRTVQNPWGTGHNVIAVGSSDLAGARKAVEMLGEHIRAGDDLTIPRLHEVKLTGATLQAFGSIFAGNLDERWAQSHRDRANRHLATAGTRGLFSMAEGVGRDYALTGRDEYALMYAWMIRRTYENYLGRPTTYGGPWGMDSDFHIYRNMTAWEAVEHCPALTDDDRLEISRILFQWVSEVGPRKTAPASSRRVRFNHQTFPALGCLYAGQYFYRHYNAIEGREWIRLADDTFQFQLGATKPHCDSESYQWLTLLHATLYALARPDLSYLESGNARVTGDYAIAVMNNMGYQVAYGDIGRWGGLGAEVSLLRILEWYHRDGRYQWALDRKAQAGARPAVGAYDPAFEHAQEPSDLLGALLWPLDDLWYETFVGDRQVPREKAFDKVVFRSSFEPDGQYLLLSGLSLGGHCHHDGNSVLQWYQNGRIWAADGDYIKAQPKYHCGTLILRDGQSEQIPGLVELENFADLPSAGISRTVLRNYAGVHWNRNIVWLPARMFIVVDQMTATEPDDYSFRACWRTVGDVYLDGSRMLVEQDGQHAVFAMSDDVRCIVTDDPATGKNWSSYPHAREPVIRAMQGIIRETLTAGEQVNLFTALHASGEQASQVRIHRLGPNMAGITGDDEPIIVAVGDSQGRISIPGIFDAAADVMVLTPRQLYAANVRQVRVTAAELSFADGADIEADIATGDALMLSPARRTAVAPEQKTTRMTLGRGLDPAELAEKMRELIAASQVSSSKPAFAAVDAPELQERWRFRDQPNSYLLTDNHGSPERVAAVADISVNPTPLPGNVFSGGAGANRLENAFDGALTATGDAVMWDTDEEVTITMRLVEPCDLERMVVHAWFVTASSKPQLYQVGRIRLMASSDAFADDVRTLVDFADEEQHPNWGGSLQGPHAYVFDDLSATARELRLVITPRPGTGIYLAEVAIWGGGAGLQELAAAGEAVGGYGMGTLHSADLTGDGNSELIAGSSGGTVFCLDASGGMLWRHDTGAEVTSVTCVDFTGDGALSVVVGTMGGGVVALNANGSRRWKYEVPYYKRNPHVRLVFPADLDGDGRQSVIAGADSWRFYAIDDGGQYRWHYESVHGSTSGTAADLDGDGRDEVIAGTEYYWWHAVNPDGSRRWQCRTASGPGANAVAAGNLTGDARREVLFGGADSLVQVYDEAGARLWTFSTGDEVTDLACADVTGDGRDEIFVTSLSFNVYCLDWGGNLRWRVELPHQMRALALTHPGQPDEDMLLLAGCEDGVLYVMRAADGTICGVYDIGSPVVAVATGQSATGRWAALSSADGRLRAFDLPR